MLSLNKKICIIVGHGKSKSGGYDSGAVSPDRKHHEFQIAKEIARHAAEYLGCDLMNYNGDLYLTERIKKVNKSDYDFIAEIHLNAAGGTGVETYYYKGSSTGLKASQAICNEISDSLGVENRGPKVRTGKTGRDYFAIIRDTKPCAVLVETVFIDRKSDLEKIRTAEGQRACGEAIGRALESVFGDKPQGNKKEDSFRIEIICKSLYIRNGAGTKFKTNGVVKNGDFLTVRETDAAGAWGRLENGRGWVSLHSKYVRKI